VLSADSLGILDWFNKDPSAAPAASRPAPSGAVNP
jgi:hypothetical protein